MMAVTDSSSKNSLNILSENKPWYADGLKFKCTECGKCCTGGPGYAWVTKEEIKAIADHLGMTTTAFGKKYLRYINGRYALLEQQNYDCIFLKDKKCQIYQVRPIQCRTFPWWKENLASPEAWKEAAKHCEGITQDDAPVIAADIINAQVALWDDEENT